MAIPRLFIIALCLAAGTAAACNEHQPVLETPASPTAVVPPPRLPDIAGVSIAPGAVDGGEQATGTVSLSGPAPSATTVSLSANDEAASIPATVTVAAGDTSATFRIETLRFPNDRVVIISASTGQQTRSTNFQVWTIESPMFFKFYSDESDFIGQGEVAKFVPGSSTFSAFCDGNTVDIRISTQSGFWSAVFRTPGNEPLRPGIFTVPGDGAARADAYMMISGRSRGCNTAGRFSIDEVDLRNNRVNVFRAHFEQRCTGQNNRPPGGIRGEVRVQSLPPSTSFVNCLR